MTCVIIHADRMGHSPQEQRGLQVQQEIPRPRVRRYVWYGVLVTLYAFVFSLLRSGILPYAQIDDPTHFSTLHGKPGYTYDILTVLIGALWTTLFLFTRYVLPLVILTFTIHQNFSAPAPRILEKVFVRVLVAITLGSLLPGFLLIIYGEASDPSGYTGLAAINLFMLTLLAAFGMLAFAGASVVFVVFYRRSHRACMVFQHGTLLVFFLLSAALVAHSTMVVTNQRTCGVRFPDVVSTTLGSTSHAYCTAAQAVRQNNPNLCYSPYKYGGAPGLCLDLVARAQRPSGCEQLGEKYGVGVSNVSCTAAQAVLQNNPDLCGMQGEYLEKPESEQLCYKLVAREQRSPIACERLGEKYGRRLSEHRDCYLSLMEETKDVSLCLRHEVFGDGSEWCFQEAARRLQNPSICERIARDFGRLDCLQQFQRGGG